MGHFYVHLNFPTLPVQSDMYFVDTFNAVFTVLGTIDERLQRAKFAFERRRLIADEPP